ncbi:MAG: beta-ketoacyl-ACP synthase II [Actinomycetota bacterium]
MRKVVVTGIGPATPVGVGREAFWSSLSGGRSGIGAITRFDTEGFPVRIAGEVGDFDPGEFMEPKEVRRTDRFVHLVLGAAQLAHRDSGSPELTPERTAVVMGTGIGGMATIEEQVRNLVEKGPDRVSPFMVPAMMPNAAAGHVAMALGLTGPNMGVVTACAASTHAIGEAFRTIREDRADVAFAGGSDASVTPVSIAAFARMGALSRNPDAEHASRPFDSARDGFVLSEGACVLVLEEEERAKARGATIYAEIAGYGATADAFHVTQPEPEGLGAIAAMHAALSEAGEAAEAVGYVNAHGTSTPLNDAAEAKAIRKVFGEHQVAVSSTKSMTGHLLGAAGAVEAAAAVLAIHEGTLPPTINLDDPAPECDLDHIANSARSQQVDLALSNSFGFGGQNAVLAIRRA